MKREQNFRPRGLDRLVLVGAVFWSAVVLILVTWEWAQVRREAVGNAATKVEAVIAMDMAFRRWASDHGGVYVSPDEKTPPNPYLAHLPDRDVVTTDGKKLTLMNSTYVLRQIMEDYPALDSLKGHITSLKVLNPANAPDAWEKAGLLGFERGATEVAGEAMIGGQLYYRLMMPFATERSCLKCHAQQGYKVGDIRGGISAAVLLAPHMEQAWTRFHSTLAGFGFLWLMGMGGHIVIWWQSRVYFRHQLAVMEELANTRADLEHAQQGAELLKRESRLREGESERALGTLAAGVAHEINNMLLPILALSRMTRDQMPADDPTHGRLSKVVDAAERMKKLVEQVSDFGAIEAEEMHEEDLNDVVHDALGFLHQTLPATLSIKERLHPSPLRVNVDRHRIASLLINLAGNAVDAVDALRGVTGHAVGTLVVSLGVERLGQENAAFVSNLPPADYARIEVSDSGIGMDAQTARHAFEPFFTTKEVGAGSGLGLTVARGIAQAHGGDIALRSIPGQGTSVTVWIPLRTD